MLTIWDVVLSSIVFCLAWWAAAGVVYEVVRRIANSKAIKKWCEPTDGVPDGLALAASLLWPFIPLFIASAIVFWVTWKGTKGVFSYFPRRSR